MMIIVIQYIRYIREDFIEVFKILNNLNLENIDEEIFFEISSMNLRGHLDPYMDTMDCEDEGDKS